MFVRMQQHAKAMLLVIEDDAPIRRGLLDVLVFNGYEAVGTADGAEGLKLGLERQFDVIIVDVMLPALDGLTICQRLRAKKPAQGILILTAKGAEDDIIKGFQAGADDYICKPFSVRELLVRVEALLRRLGKNPNDEEFRWRNLAFSSKTLTACDGEQTVVLTRKELDILAYFYCHQDRIVSKKELLSDVWNYSDPEIETRTVDIHIMKLRKKLAAFRQGGALIQTIRGEGYRLEPEEGRRAEEQKSRRADGKKSGK